jgi:hypothetical protein
MEGPMDGSRFDAWTRRRFGLVAGGLAAMLVGAIGPQVAKAKKKGKGKRCKRLSAGCNPNGNLKCCGNLKCRPVPALGGNHCCRAVLGTPCVAPTECCSGFCLDDQCQPAFCKEIGQPCVTGPECCSGVCTLTQCAVA